MPHDPFFRQDLASAFDNAYEETKNDFMNDSRKANGMMAGLNGHNELIPTKKESLNQRDAYSDTEEESNGKASIIRKVDMLQVNDVD